MEGKRQLYNRPVMRWKCAGVFGLVTERGSRVMIGGMPARLASRCDRHDAQDGTSPLIPMTKSSLLQITDEYLLYAD